MILQINPKEFVKNFIHPINELNREGKIALFCEEDKIYSIARTSSHTIHLYNTYTPLHIQDAESRCSLNITKLVKGLQCIESEDQFISLNISREEGTCSFSTKEIRFNVRLLDDSLVDVPKFNVQAFNKFEVNHALNIDSARCNNIKKALDFSSETGKFQIEQEGTNIYFYFGDKASSSKHLDDIRILVAEDVHTNVPTKIYDVDILRLVVKSKNNFSMKLNDNGVMYIEIENPNSNLKYITTPLKK